MKTILIIDDSSYSRHLIQQALQDEGYTLLQADNDLSALEQLQNHAVDLITLDLIMPGISGEELLPRLKALAPQARIVVLTADVQTLSKEALLAGGVDAYLHKPINPEQLRTTIRQILQKK